MKFFCRAESRYLLLRASFKAQISWFSKYARRCCKRLVLVPMCVFVLFPAESKPFPRRPRYPLTHPDEKSMQQKRSAVTNEKKEDGCENKGNRRMVKRECCIGRLNKKIDREETMQISSLFKVNAAHS